MTTDIHPVFVTFYKLLFSAVILICCVICLYLTDGDHQKWYLERAPCKTPYYEDLIELAFRTHHVLDKLLIPHFLCYGTLWGVVRIGRILPWDNNIDICVLDEDISRVDEGFLHTTFRRESIASDYDSRHGHYYLQYRGASGFITVFKRYRNQMHRAGWQIRLFPFLFKEKHIFPARLVEMPFANDTFHGTLFPVPRENYEILKYLYVNDWWKFMIPMGC